MGVTPLSWTIAKACGPPPTGAGGAVARRVVSRAGVGRSAGGSAGCATDGALVAVPGSSDAAVAVALAVAVGEGSGVTSPSWKPLHEVGDGSQTVAAATPLSASSATADAPRPFRVR